MEKHLDTQKKFGLALSIISVFGILFSFLKYFIRGTGLVVGVAQNVFSLIIGAYLFLKVKKPSTK